LKKSINVNGEEVPADLDLIVEGGKVRVVTDYVEKGYGEEFLGSGFFRGGY